MIDFGKVSVPFGKLYGWPLEAVVKRRFGYFNWLTKQDLSATPDFAEAVKMIAAEPAVAERLERYRKQCATQAQNRRRFDAWVMR